MLTKLNLASAIHLTLEFMAHILIFSTLLLANLLQKNHRGCPVGCFFARAFTILAKYSFLPA